MYVVYLKSMNWQMYDDMVERQLKTHKKLPHSCSSSDGINVSLTFYKCAPMYKKK
jgi:hypothetical protein